MSLVSLPHATLRRPRVAGYYYPQDAASLRHELDRLFAPTQGCAPVDVHAVILPHGSYHFSGTIAAAAIGRVRIPARCVMVAPNHTGTGAPWSVMRAGAYATPLGEVPIHEEWVERLRAACPFLEEDLVAHQTEHAIEVPLPFLQWSRPADLSIVPIIINSDNPEEWASFSEALADVLTEEDALLVATTDLTHYEPRDVAMTQDQPLLEAMERLDSEGLRQAAAAQATALCGLGPVVCAMETAKHLGATHAQPIAYGTSAEQGGDPSSVTSYASLIIP